MKKWLILVLIVLFSFSFVNAYSKEKGLEWLNSNMEWSSDSIEEVSFALLALRSNGYEVDTPHNILSQKVPPSGSFDSVKETALTTLALDFFNDDITSLLTGIESELTKASIEDWFIQITTNSNGICNITHKTNSVEVTVNGNEKLVINGNEIGYWLSIETYLGAVEDPIETIRIDCSEVADSSMIISLLRIPTPGEFFIIEEKTGNNIVLEINNACYPEIIGGACDVETTFYVSWVLNKLGEELKTQPYLEDNAEDNLHYAMLGSIIGSQNKYTDLLKDNQAIEGGWDTDIITTSFAINTLRPVRSTYLSEFNNATSWLEDQQDENNESFGGKLETAAALYLALTEVAVPPTDNGVSGYCGDDIWDFDLGEECDAEYDFSGNKISGEDDACPGQCQTDCTCSEPTFCTDDTYCLSGYVCDLPTSACVPEELPPTCPTNSIYECPNTYDYECVNKVCRPITVPVNCGEFDWKCPKDYSCIGGSCQFTGTEPECGFNYQCDTDVGEYCDTSIGTCKTLEEDDCGNGFCDSDESERTCPEDCQPIPDDICGDGICQLSEDEDFCPEDCAEEEGFPFWIIWLLIIIIILVGGGWFFYSKYLKKPKTSEKPSFLGPSKPETEKQPRTQQRATAPPRFRSRDPHIERELDRSIREAQKLLRRK